MHARAVVRFASAAFASAVAAIAALAFASFAGTGAAHAQAYPAKPVRMLVSIAAGSVTDVIMRAAAPELSARLGQSVVVENRPGGAMVIGAESCARAAPDGYTLCVMSGDSMSLNPHLVEKLPYDPDRDFKPVAMLFYVIEGLVAKSALPVASVAELRSLAVARPGSLNFGTVGPGSIPDLFVGWLRDRWKADIAAVPYKGGGPVAAALVAGEIDAASMGLGNFIGAIQAGRVKALAVGGSKRVAALPDVPTLAEAGLGEFPGRAWCGMLAPAGTPDPIVARLNAEVVRLFADPKFAAFTEARFVEPAAGSPEQFAAFMKTDRQRAAGLVKLATPAQK